MRTEGFWLALAVASLGIFGIAAAQPVTDSEARAMAPDALKDRLVQQLGAILLPLHVNKYAPTQQPMFVTIPHGVWQFELCTRDRIEFELQSTQHLRAQANAPQTVGGLRATKLFRFLTPPNRQTIRYALNETEMTKLDADCAAARDAHFFEADYAGLAFRGAAYLDAVHRDIESGKLPRGYTCEHLWAGECRQLIDSLNLENLFSVAPCWERGWIDAGCVILSNNEVELIVRAKDVFETPSAVTVRRQPQME